MVCDRVQVGELGVEEWEVELSAARLPFDALTLYIYMDIYICTYMHSCMWALMLEYKALLDYREEDAVL